MTVEKFQLSGRSFCCVWGTKIRSVVAPVWEQIFDIWLDFVVDPWCWRGIGKIQQLD